MSNLSKNLIDIFKVVGNDKELLRLLYYTSDPLNPTKPEVIDLEDFQEIRRERIVRAPKTNDIQDDSTIEICRICMYFGNRSNTGSATKFAYQDVVFDIYVHIDAFEVNDARSLRITDRLNKILHNQSITGFSSIKSDRMFIIGNSPSGYIGYKYIYEFISENY
ncbi:hypothetical protein V7128_01260 [Neobacillus vireti]|uniref:hypothetical protein n=1 Tax=Neobacillus vireti TaxID=220686 RepID=UPI002FFDDF18